MNMLNHPDPRGAWPLDQETQFSHYDLTIRVTVNDPAMLWRRAAAHLLTFGGVDEAVLEETIGSAEDPSVADCLAAILGPMQIEGLRYEMFSIRSAAGNDRPQPVLCGG